MNNNADRMLEQLFQAAKAAKQPVPGPMPAHLRTRVLAHWRSGAADDGWLRLALLVRKATVIAAVLTLVTFAWCYHDLISSPESAEAVANYELRADLWP